MFNAALLWTDDEVEELKVRWSAGLTCSEIGTAMDKSRNAVIGKVHRLGLDGRKKTTTAADRERSLRARYERNARQKKLKRRQNREVEVEEQIEAMPAFIGSLNIPFDELRDFSNCEPNECRFIADEPPGPLYLSCGTETPPGEPYCAHCKPITLNRSGLTQAERALFIAMGVRKHLRALRHVA